jgi:hypothetical protein
MGGLIDIKRERERKREGGGGPKKRSEKEGLKGREWRDGRREGMRDRDR